MLARSGWRSIISLALYASQVRGVHGNISILLILPLRRIILSVFVFLF